MMKSTILKSYQEFVDAVTNNNDLSIHIKGRPTVFNIRYICAVKRDIIISSYDESTKILSVCYYNDIKSRSTLTAQFRTFICEPLTNVLRGDVVIEMFSDNE